MCTECTFLISCSHPSLCAEGLCPFPGIRRHSSCYRYFSKPLSWHEANASCAKNNLGHLVELLTKSDEVFVSQNVVKGGFYWIGLSDLKTKDQFVWEKRGDIVWTNDYKPPGSYSNFPPGNPNGRGQANCVAVWANANFPSWEDGSCNRQLPFVCEKYTQYESIDKGGKSISPALAKKSLSERF